MRDLYSNSIVKALITATRWEGLTGTGIKTGTAVDLAGEGRKCLLVVNVGATSTATCSITVQQAATSGAAFSTLGDVLVLDTTGLTVVDLTPTMRYIRALVTLSETSAEACYVEVSVEGIIYNERYQPSNVT